MQANKRMKQTGLKLDSFRIAAVQSSSVFMDLGATIDKACRLIEAAMSRPINWSVLDGNWMSRATMHVPTSSSFESIAVRDRS